MTNNSQISMNQISMNRIITVLFSSFIPAIPILEYYNSPLNIFSMAMFLVVLFFIFFIFNPTGEIRVISPIILFMSFITLNMFISSKVQGTEISDSTILSWGRTCFWLVTIFMFGSKFFDKNVGFKVLKILLYISVVMMIIQYMFFNFFSIQIPSTLPFLFREQGYYDRSISSFYRPSGLYMEPSHFAMSAILFLTYALFGENKTDTSNLNISWVSVVIISLGIILSTSGQGYLFLSIVFFMWYVSTFILKIYIKRIAMGILIVLFSILILLSSLELTLVQNTLNRLFDGDSIGGEALAGRVGTSVFFMSLPENIKWVGIGYGNSESVLYMSSFYRFLYECGYFSIIFLGFLLISALKRGSRYVKFFVIILAIMSYFSSPFSTAYLSFFFAFLYAYDQKKFRNI